MQGLAAAIKGMSYQELTKGRELSEADQELRQFIYDQIDKTAGAGCWLWTGTVSHAGTPTALYDGELFAVFNEMYRLEHGAETEDSHYHTCKDSSPDYRRCVNPAHRSPRSKSSRYSAPKSEQAMSYTQLAWLKGAGVPNEELPSTLLEADVLIGRIKAMRSEVTDD